MKKLFTLLFVIAIVAFALPQATPALAVGDEYPPALVYYDAQIDVLWPRLQNFQSQYHTVNGYYYQALESNSTVPEVPTLPDGLNEAPSDQPETLALFWQDFAELPTELSWSFHIDTYSGPDGDGYVLTVDTLIDGQTWRRSLNYGPDTWRADDWYLFDPNAF